MNPKRKPEPKECGCGMDAPTARAILRILLAASGAVEYHRVPLTADINEVSEAAARALGVKNTVITPWVVASINQAVPR